MTHDPSLAESENLFTENGILRTSLPSSFYFTSSLIHHRLFSRFRSFIYSGRGFNFNSSQAKGSHIGFPKGAKWHCL